MKDGAWGSTEVRAWRAGLPGPGWLYQEVERWGFHCKWTCPWSCVRKEVEREPGEATLGPTEPCGLIPSLFGVLISHARRSGWCPWLLPRVLSQSPLDTPAWEHGQPCPEGWDTAAQCTCSIQARLYSAVEAAWCPQTVAPFVPRLGPGLLRTSCLHLGTLLARAVESAPPPSLPVFLLGRRSCRP